MRMLTSPPPWAEAFLRELLGSRDRDTVSGDLLEEYRESVLPERGPFRARLWYLRQVLSLLTLSRFTRLASGFAERNTMASKNLVASLAWTASAFAALCAVVAMLIRSRFGPPSPSIFLFLIPVVLVICAATALRSPSILPLLWRAGRIWAAAFAVVLAIRMAVDAIAPFDVERFFLAQSRSDFSEFDFPRRFLVEIAVGLIVIAAGFHGAWKTGRVRPGILVAMAASLMVSIPVAAVSAFVAQSAAPLVMTILALAVSALLGSIGAMLGRGAGGMVPRKEGALC